MIWSAIITKAAATILAAYGFGLITPIGWTDISIIWAYSIGSAVVTDIVKVEVYRHFQRKVPRHRQFLKRIKQPLRGAGRSFSQRT